MHIETVVHTQEDRRAILYDTGLALPSASKTRFAWVDTEGKLERQEAVSRRRPIATWLSGIVL